MFHIYYYKFLQLKKEERTKNIIELLQIIKTTGNEELMRDNKIYQLYKNELDKSG